jgi:hypothetical protein
MKTPTTRRLSRWQQSNTIGYIPIADDEKFYQIPCYSDIYVSQFAQFIQVLPNGDSMMRNAFFDIKTGYTNIVLSKRRGRKVNRTCRGVHDLVASVWLEKPTFAGTDERLQVHHLMKVKRNMKMQPIDINFAENLEYVYWKYHKLVDITRSIKVATYGGNWKSVKTIEDISKHYRVPLLEIYELLLQKPSNKVDTVEYYETEIDKKVVAIEIRKFVTKKKK